MGFARSFPCGTQKAVKQTGLAVWHVYDYCYCYDYCTYEACNNEINRAHSLICRLMLLLPFIFPGSLMRRSNQIRDKRKGRIGKGYTMQHTKAAGREEITTAILFPQQKQTKKKKRMKKFQSKSFITMHPPPSSLERIVWVKTFNMYPHFFFLSAAVMENV